MAETKVLNETDGARRRAAIGRRQKAPSKAAAPKQSRALPVVESRPIDGNWIAWAVAILLAGVWAYWPTLRDIVKAWANDQEYTIGFFAVPVAVFILYMRRASYPGIGPASYAWGFGLFGFAMLMRYLGALFYFDFVDGYSILFWLAGAVAILGGGKLLWWALPAIGFLFFMIPLPFGIATSMSAPLQRISTKLTCFALQVLGQPAFAEGNVIVIGDVKLEVAQACSGLKMFIQFVAMAYGYAVVVRRPWWERVCLFAAIAPFCILANSTRITLVGLMDLYTNLSHVRSDFMAGLVVIVLAFTMFGGLLWYLSVLISEEEVMDMSYLVRDADA